MTIAQRSKGQVLLLVTVASARGVKHDCLHCLAIQRGKQATHTKKTEADTGRTDRVEIKVRIRNPWKSHEQEKFRKNRGNRKSFCTAAYEVILHVWDRFLGVLCFKAPPLQPTLAQEGEPQEGEPQEGEPHTPT